MKFAVYLLYLVILVSIIYSAPPSWVGAGVNVNYTVGTQTVSFSVLNRSDPDIKLEIRVYSSSGTLVSTSRPTDNASLTSGQFWVDDTLLPNTFIGDVIDGFTVSDISSQTFAGQSWEAVTMDGIESGYSTKKIYDKATGLLLKKTVQAPGAAAAVISQYYIPVLAPPPAAPPPSAPPANPSSNNTQPLTQPSSQPTSQASNTTSSASVPAVSVDDYLQPPKPQSIPCCPFAFVLLLAGYLVIKENKK